MNLVCEILKEAVELFGENGEHWTQLAGARDSEGLPVAPDSHAAVTWCAWGAVGRVVMKNHGHDSNLRAKCGAALTEAILHDTQHSYDYVYYNDTHDFSYVKKMFATAIEQACEATGE